MQLNFWVKAQISINSIYFIFFRVTIVYRIICGLITLLKFILLNAPHYKINKNTKRNWYFKLTSKLILSQYPDIAFNC